VEKAGLVLVRSFHQSWPNAIDGDEYGDVEYALDRQQSRKRHAPAEAEVERPGPP